MTATDRINQMECPECLGTGNDGDRQCPTGDGRAARQPQAGGRPLQVEDPEFLELLRASGGRLVRGEPQAIVTSLALDQGE
jgi:hypothetical protein